MKNLGKIWAVILTAVCLFLCSLLFSKCENEKTQLKTISALNSELKQYKLENGKLAWSVESIGYTEAQLRKNIIEKDSKIKELTSKFSKVKSVTKQSTSTVVPLIEVKYKDTVPCVYEKTGAIEDKYYTLDYKSTQKGISITNLKIPDTLITVVGQKRKWFLGKETTTIDVTHSNKYVQTNSLQHVEVVPSKKWYETTIFKVGAGFIMGAVLSR